MAVASTATPPEQPTTAPVQPSVAAQTGMWPLSKRTRPLVINAGDGSTGTRFMHCVMGKLGLKSVHQFRNGGRAYGTRVWDEFDHISDSPVGYMATQLLRSHPGNLASVVLMLRNPWDWHRARQASHYRARSGSCWQPANGGCGQNFTSMCNKDGFSMERDMLSNAAFVACLAFQGRAAARVAVFSLFAEPEGGAMYRLQGLLNTSGYPGITMPRMAVAWKACNTPRVNRNHQGHVENAVARVVKKVGADR